MITHSRRRGRLFASAPRNLPLKRLLVILSAIFAVVYLVMPGPAAWAATRKMPGFSSLGPEYDDFGFASRAILTKAHEYMGTKDQAQIGLIGAQTEKARAEALKAQREAVEGSSGLGKEIKPY